MNGWGGWYETNATQDDANKLKQMLSTKFSQHYELKAHQAPPWIVAAPTSLLQQDQQVLLLSADTTVTKTDIVEEYQHNGIDGLKKFKLVQGPLVLIDSQQQLVILRTDPVGLQNIFYAETSQGLVFGDSADIVISHPQVSREISSQAVYDYVYYHHCPSPNTIYKQVKKLEGGQLLVYKNGQLNYEYYWIPAFVENIQDSSQSLGESLLNSLTTAVAKHASDADKVGAFLSGGLDSSSVAGALAKVFPGKAKTFTMGFPVEGYDEIEYARMAVEHFNTRQHEYYITPEDTVKAIPKIAAYYDEPFGNSSALAAYYCAKLAKDNGIEVLLAGDGGDELFAGNERYAKQLLFEPYHRLPKFAQTSLKGIINHLPGVIVQQKLFHKIRRYIEQAETPMPDRLQDYNFLHRHASEDIFQADFLQQIDPHEPLSLLRDVYKRPEQADTLNRMLYMDWKSTLHDNDLVKVNRMCQMAGVEVRYPLLDLDIVALSLSVPSLMKLKGQKLRWFYKQSVKDFLPGGIINKSKHGFGLPFGVWLKDHKPLQELAYASIEQLKQRPYFKEQFLDHSIQMHQSVHASYYGELIWILMMLELWFQEKNL